MFELTRIPFSVSKWFQEGYLDVTVAMKDPERPSAVTSFNRLDIVVDLSREFRFGSDPEPLEPICETHSAYDPSSKQDKRTIKENSKRI